MSFYFYDLQGFIVEMQLTNDADTSNQFKIRPWFSQMWIA